MSGDNEPEDDGLIECWCGAVGDYDELFSDLIDDTCGGTGMLHCECGGDGLCVCHWHGETSCDGCEDCWPDDDDGQEWGYDE